MGRRWRKGRKPKDVKWHRKGKREEITKKLCQLYIILTAYFIILVLRYVIATPDSLHQG